MSKSKWTNSNPPRECVKLYTKAIRTTWAGLQDTHTGLANLGNTCYLNSSLQALFHIPSFVDFLEDDKQHRKECRSLLGCIICTLHRTLLNMRLQKVFRPVGIVSLLYKISRGKLKVGNEEDAQEFLTNLSQTIVTDLLRRVTEKGVKPDFCTEQTTAMGEIFGGWHKTTDECQSCKHHAETFNPICQIFVTCEQSIQLAVDKLFTQPEAINDFSCAKGCKKTFCYRRTRVHSHPQVLKVVLKRFNDFGERLSQPIIVNKWLTVGDANYKFLSGVVHTQLGSGGHFLAITACPNGTLTLFNDSQVIENWSGLQSSVIQRGLYVAFFELQKEVPGPKKRPPERSPSGRSPFHKKLQANLSRNQDSPRRRSPYAKSLLKANTFSPKKRTFPKMFGLHHKTNDMDSVLAKPLHSSGFLTAGKERIMESAALDLPVVTFNNRRRISMRDAESEPSTCRSQDSTVTAKVSPLKLNFNPAKPLENICESQEEYEQNEGSTQGSSTVTAVVTPFKLKMKPVPEHARQLITVTSTCGSQDSTVTAEVSPLKLNFNPAKPLENICKSQEEYEQNEGSTQGSSTVTAVVTPFKLKMKPVPESHARQTSSVTDMPIDINLDPVSEERFNSSNETGPSNNESTQQQQMQCYAQNTAYESNELEMHLDNDLFSQNEEIGNMENPYFPEEITFEEDACDITDEQAILDANKFQPIYLTSKDVPGADLPHTKLGKNTNKDLSRWLKLRGVANTASKDELCLRVEACVNTGEDKIITAGADGGIWYDKKRELMSTQAARQLPNSILFPEKGWEPFPSRDLPPSFNFGSVYFYLVESMPQYENPNLMNSGEELNSEEEDDVDAIPDDNEKIIPLGDIFEDLKNEAVLSSKKIRRGLKFLKSGYIRGLADCLPDRFHFFKAHVRASMELKAYWVKVAISQISGSILRCECHCKASKLGRCSHVSSLLFFILQHKHLNGDKAITCTSKPCTWNTGSLKRDPWVAARQYESFKINVIRRNLFDPRPTEHRNEPTKDRINDFIRALRRSKEIPCAFQGILKIEYDDFSYDNSDLQILKYLRRELYHYLIQLQPKEHIGPFQLQGTTDNFKSALYRFVRSITCTSSVCHRIANFQSESAKKNFLRQQMWNLEDGGTKGMAYGNENEPNARAKYLEEQMDPTIQVLLGGTHLHTQYPGLSCSHDGLIARNGKVIKVLEIKCPYSLQEVDPNHFDSFLKGKKLSAFYLTRNVSGKIRLKENSRYYDQVQMELALTGLPLCDFVVWSKKGLLTIPIPFNHSAWANLHPKLEKFHWEYMAVEYFTRRTTMELDPLCLQSDLP